MKQKVGARKLNVIRTQMRPNLRREQTANTRPDGHLGHRGTLVRKCGRRLQNGRSHCMRTPLKKRSTERRRLRRTSEGTPNKVSNRRRTHRRSTLQKSQAVQDLNRRAAQGQPSRGPNRRRTRERATPKKGGGKNKPEARTALPLPEHTLRPDQREAREPGRSPETGRKGPAVNARS